VSSDSFAPLSFEVRAEAIEAILELKGEIRGSGLSVCAGERERYVRKKGLSKEGRERRGRERNEGESERGVGFLSARAVWE